MTARWDVAIVGGGPAGSSSAAILARLGYRVILLDRSHFPRPKACAEYMSPGVLEALHEIGLEGTLLDGQSLEVPGMDIVAPNGSLLRVDYQTHGRVLSAHTLTRLTFDAALVAEAARRGVEVCEGVTARSAIVEEGVVRGVRASRAGRQMEVRAALTLIADGARSVMAHSLGLSRTARWPVRLGLVAHYEGVAPLEDGHGQMHVAESGYCGVAPLPSGRLNVAAVVRADALKRSRGSATEYLEGWIAGQPRLRALLGGCLRVTSVRGLSPIGARSSRAWAPGALLVGDAASFFDPFTGEGIYRALVGARLAAEAADRALCSGDVSAASLREYDAMRRRAFLRKEGVTRLVQLFVQYPRLLEYAVPRLRDRETARGTLGLVLGDALDARAFLRPSMLWEALRP